MPENEWKKIEAILDRVLELPADRRSLFVRQACKGDEDLIKEVESILQAIEESEQAHFLQHAWEDNKDLLNDFSGSLDSSHDEESIIGMRVGPFKITELAGSGGMATVYRGERVDGQFHQSVAIKIIKQGIYSQKTALRFKDEQEILAGLHHPHIAQLYDGGLTSNDIPYLIMEYVDGIPIDRYAEKYKLTITQRLDLFEKVCEAVQYAHNNLVVHRDLKSQNILVNANGDVKILDFGVAKLMKPTTEAAAHPSSHEEHFWTPQYAAPELVKNNSISTAGDIYALGVLLYKLMSGAFPFEMMGKSYSEMRQLILNEIPEKPSKALGQLVNKQEIASNRQVTVSRLQKKLKGDLDCIIGKAIRKDPELRFESVRHFIEEIQRYREDLPLLARKGNAGYKLEKFLHRNAVPVASFFVTLIILATTITYYTIRLTKQRNKALSESHKAHLVTDFMVDIFKDADPYHQKNRDITAREILDKGTQKIRKEIKGEPEIKATLLSNIGSIYEDLGLYKKAGPLLHEALSIRQKLYNQDNYDLANSLHMWADYNEMRGYFKKAKKYFKESGSMFIRLQNDTSYAASVEELGWVNYLTGDYNLADSLVRASLDIYRKAYGNQNKKEARGDQYLAWISNAKGNYGKADSLFRSALALRQIRYQGDHPLKAQTLQSLGRTLYNEQQYDSAGAYIKQALAMQHRLFGDKHPDIAVSLNILGLIKQKQHQYELSGKYLSQSYKMIEKFKGKNDPTVVKYLGNLATTYFYDHNYSRAADIFKKVLIKNKVLLGTDHPEIATDYNNLGMCLWRGGRKDAALSNFKKSVAVAQKALPAINPHLIYFRKNMADLSQEMGNNEMAARERLQNFTSLRDHLGIKNKRTQQVLQRVIALYEDWDKPEKVTHYQALLDNDKRTGN